MEKDSSRLLLHYCRNPRQLQLFPWITSRLEADDPPTVSAHALRLQRGRSRAPAPAILQSKFMNDNIRLSHVIIAPIMNDTFLTSGFSLLVCFVEFDRVLHSFALTFTHMSTVFCFDQRASRIECNVVMTEVLILFRNSFLTPINFLQYMYLIILISMEG